MTQRRLVPLAEGAKHADVSTVTIRRWIKSNRITGYRQGPKLLKVDLDELDAMVTPITKDADAGTDPDTPAEPAKADEAPAISAKGVAA